MFPGRRLSRREFLAMTAAATATAAWFEWPSDAAEGGVDRLGLSSLPKGPTPAPVSLPHFPDRLHAFVWRNWELVPIARLARVLATSARNVAVPAAAEGLPEQPGVTAGPPPRFQTTG